MEKVDLSRLLNSGIMTDRAKVYNATPLPFRGSLYSILTNNCMN